jgi:TonB-dependent starch-binding outer membrane protein SusC
MKKVLLLCFMILPWFISFGQQTREITGKVLDARDQSSLPGATIIVKGTQAGAVTNYDGVFTYTVNAADVEKVILLVSYIGYKSQSVRIGAKSNFEILLEEDFNSLEEVVVTSSYGTKKLKQEVVGSISSINTKDMIIEQSVTSFDELLEGQTAGVLIESGSELGSQVKIHIRGVGSLSSGNNTGTSTQPLIIVDGVILAEEVALDGSQFFDGAGGNFSEDFMNPLAKIGIKDIESINVLKDAAAVSLYGADGANGVIIITTKRGQKGPMKFAFTAQGGASSAMNRTQYMNGEQYQELRNLYYLNSGNPNNVQPWNGVNTDWYDLLNRTGTFQRYNFSFSGGGDKLNYRTALGYSRIEESQVNNNFSKYNTSFSLNYKHKKLTIGMKVAPSFSMKNSPNTLYNYAVPPNIAPYDEFGEYTRFENYGNPLAVANQNRGLSETFSLLNSFNASYEPLKDLVISTLFGMDYSFKDQDTFYSGLNESGIDNSGNYGIRILRDRDTQRWNWNARVSYKKVLGEHSFDLLGGVEARSNFVSYSYATGKNFPDTGRVLPIEMAENQDYKDDTSESTGRSFFSQVNYDFKKKYFLLGNFRVDQSSAFGSDNNTSFNGGFGASWVISNEDFMEGLTFLEFLRLRVSYGTSGNSRIGSYRALGLYKFTDTGGGGYNQGFYAAPYTAPNPYLGWERNYKFNAGLDITTTFRLSLTVEFFNDFINDMIVSRDVIYETGYSTVQINGADMYNRGIEVGLRGNVVSSSNFKWNSQFNVSFIKNEVTRLVGLGSEFSGAETVRSEKIGYSTSIMWGYEFAGIDPATGRELYLINGDLVDGITLKTDYRDKEFWQPIGSTQPDFYGGFNNRFSFGKNISLAVNMSYQYGAEKLINREFLDHYRNISSRNMAVNAYLDSWRQPGDIALYPAPVDNIPLFSNSTKYLFNTSRIKLNSVNFSYKIPVKNSRIPLDQLRVYLNASNLYYWYMDRPAEGRNGVAEMTKIYPEMRTFSIGINANF